MDKYQCVAVNLTDINEFPDTKQQNAYAEKWMKSLNTKSEHAIVIICEKENEQEEVNRIIQGKKDIYFVDNKKINSFPYKYLSPAKMIQWAIKRNPNISSIDEIEKILGFEEHSDPNDVGGPVKERLNRRWMHQGNFKCFFSVAYGIAMGKKVFVMPWMHKKVLDYQEFRNNIIYEAMSKIQGTVIFVVQDIPEESFLNNIK